MKMNIDNKLYEEFESKLNDFCSETKGKSFLEEETYAKLAEFFQKEQETNKDFKLFTYKFLNKNSTDTENDYFERVISVLFKTKILSRKYDLLDFFGKFQTINNIHSFVNYSHLQTLSINSINKVLDNIRQNKEYFKTIPCEACTIDEIDKKLTDSIKNGLEKCSFIVQRSDLHSSPVFINKNQDGSYNIFITDSFGNGTYNAQLLKIIKNMIDKDDSLKIKIYCSGFKRQHGDYGCEIFSIRDAICWSKNYDKTAEWILKNSEITVDSKSGVEYYKITSLPPQMMKLTQSIKDIQAYDIKNKSGLLTRLVAKNKIKDEKNSKVDLFQKKYAAFILESNDLLTGKAKKKTSK